MLHPHGSHLPANLPLLPLWPAGELAISSPRNSPTFFLAGGAGKHASKTLTSKCQDSENETNALFHWQVVAVEGPEASRLLGQSLSTSPSKAAPGVGTACLYFAALQVPRCAYRFISYSWH